MQGRFFRSCSPKPCGRESQAAVFSAPAAAFLFLAVYFCLCTFYRELIRSLRLRVPTVWPHYVNFTLRYVSPALWSAAKILQSVANSLPSAAKILQSVANSLPSAAVTLRSLSQSLRSVVLALLSVSEAFESVPETLRGVFVTQRPIASPLLRRRGCFDFVFTEERAHFVIHGTEPGHFVFVLLHGGIHLQCAF